MALTTADSPRLRKSVLRDSGHPVHTIADHLEPYLQVILDEFQPEQVILFGSYANGKPTPDSDVDLLIVKDDSGSPVAEATRIRRAIRHLRHSGTNLPLDIMVKSPADWRQRLQQRGSLHTEIATKGLRLI